MKKFTILISLLILTLSLSACADNPSNDQCSEVEGTDLLRCDLILSSYFDTSITLALYIEKDVDSEPILLEVTKIIANYHILSDKYNTYEGVVNVKTINDDPTSTHDMSSDLYDLIKYSLSHQSEVHDLFNIALNPVLKVWHDYSDECNYDPYLQSGTGACNIPTQTELDAAALFTDPNDIFIIDDDLSIKLEEGMSLDLGGMSKGYMSKKVTEYLSTVDVHGYLFNAGTSNVEIGGIHPTRESGQFRVAVTNPDNLSTYYATVYLSGGESIVSSGDYQRYYVSDDELYHHIIHPTTLMPERYTRSVSIVYSDPALADIYSTAIFLMPIADGIEFVNSIDGLEAIWYGLDGEVSFSENFEDIYLDQLY